MVTCKDCGTRNPSGYEFCRHCSGDLYRHRRELRKRYLPLLLVPFVRLFA